MGFAIGGFRSVLGVSVFQGSLLVIVIMIDGSEKRNCELWRRLLSFRVRMFVRSAIKVIPIPSWRWYLEIVNIFFSKGFLCRNFPSQVIIKSLVCILRTDLLWLFSAFKCRKKINLHFKSLNYGSRTFKSLKSLDKYIALRPSSFFFSLLRRPTDPNFWHFQKKKKSGDVVKPFFACNNSFNLKNEHSNIIEKNRNKNRNIFYSILCILLN